MNARFCIAIVAAACVLAAPAQAQEDTQPVAYVQMMKCNFEMLMQHEEAMGEVMNPIYDGLVEEGLVTHWHYLAHLIGDEWNRMLIATSPDMESAMRAGQRVQEEVAKADPSFVQNAMKTCPAHRDYYFAVRDGSGS